MIKSLGRTLNNCKLWEGVRWVYIHKEGTRITPVLDWCYKITKGYFKPPQNILQGDNIENL